MQIGRKNKGNKFYISTSGLGDDQPNDINTEMAAMTTMTKNAQTKTSPNIQLN